MSGFDTNPFYALSDCAWWDTSPTRRPTWLSKDCSGRVGDTILGVLCEEHYNAQPDKPEVEKMYLVCECGEAFDSIETAAAHSPMIGDRSFTIQPESEAM